MKTIEEMKEHRFDVLDHGFVRLIDYMGDETSITRAARVSYGKGTKTAREDKALIRYLMRQRHSSPLEMCEIVLHLKMPIFVARQWIRHRTASLNEYSGRYSEMPCEFYLPNELKKQSSVNKQGSGESLDAQLSGSLAQDLESSYIVATETYHDCLQNDVSRELSRIVLPLSTYTEMYWKMDLHNLLHFLKLRLDSHAQYEIRVFAEAIAEIVKVWVPVVWEAFEDFTLNAHTFSASEMTTLRNLLSAIPIERLKLQPTENWSQREIDTFLRMIT